jgi:hypothetical protein
VSREIEARVESFMDLVREYEPSLRRLVFRMLGTADAMEDVLQTALVRAYRAYPDARLSLQAAARVGFTGSPTTLVLMNCAGGDEASRSRHRLSELRLRVHP